VINIAASAIAAIAAFVFSFLIGLLTGAGMPLLIIRPLIFAVVFFALAALVYIMANRFLPEFLQGMLKQDTNEHGSDEHGSDEEHSGEHSSGGQGSIVNIVDSGLQGDEFSYNFAAAGAAPPYEDAEDSQSAGMGNISDLLNNFAQDGNFTGSAGGGLDQNDQNEYNSEGDFTRSQEQDSFVPNTGFPRVEANAAVKNAAVNKAASIGSMDFLPDLDSMAEVFSESGGDGESDTIGFLPPTPAAKKKRGGKEQTLPDFDPKEIAMGIRTALSKDKEG
jgi:hypothetical protein